MKKFSLITVTALVAILSCLCVAGCANPDPVGTWKFKEMTADASGLKLRYEAGKTYFFGEMSFTEDSFVLVVNEDNTYSLSMDMLGTTEAESGTWEVNLGKVIFTNGNGEEQKATVSGNEMTIAEKIDGVEYKIVLVFETAE